MVGTDGRAPRALGAPRPGGPSRRAPVSEAELACSEMINERYPPPSQGAVGGGGGFGSIIKLIASKKETPPSFFSVAISEIFSNANLVS